MTREDATAHRIAAVPVLESIATWRTRVVEASSSGRGPNDRLLLELAYEGARLVTGRDPLSMPPGIPVVRSDYDPVLLQLVNRVLWRCLNPTHPDGYASPSALLIDVDRLLRYLRVPHSRAVLVDELTTLLANIATGGSGTRILIGEPGIGKSYLWHLVATSAVHAAQVKVYYKAPQTGATPLEGLTLIVRSIAATLPDGAVSSALDETSASDTTRNLIGRLLHGFGSGSSSERTAAYRATGPASSELAAVVSAVVRRTGSTIVCVDDLQWLDAESLSVIELLCAPTDRLGLVLIGRPEALARICHRSNPETLTVGPLTPSERADLLESLMILPTGRLWPSKEILEWVEDRSLGNPMAIVDTIRSLDETMGIVSAPGHRAAGAATGSLSLESIARSGIEQLDPGARRLAELLGLLLPPVAAKLTAEYRTDLAALVDAYMVQIDPGERIAFRHDTIESAARSLAIGNPSAIAAAVRILTDAVASGDRRIALTLARSIAGTHPESQKDSVPEALVSAIPGSRVVSILHDAATYALDLVLPNDALAFCDYGLSMPCGGDTRPALHRIAHEAAFLNDDAAAMSRHFNAIKSQRDVLIVNQARQLWITRSYAKLAIRGALRIGSMVLRELGAHPEAWRPGTGCRESRAYLRSRGAARLARRLARRPPTADARAFLIATTCARLLLPVLTLDPNRLAAMAMVILRGAEASGSTGYEPVGFTFWRLFVGADGGGTRTRYHLTDLARTLLAGPAVAALDRPTRHWIETFTTFFGIRWEIEHRDQVHVLRSAYQSGMRIGSYEAAANAIHLGCQIQLSHGDPLDQVYTTMDAYRRVIESLGHGRTATALSKYQQATECLLGRAANPLVLTGSICNEEEIIRRNAETEDVLNELGTLRLKALLATYGDDAESAAALCRELHERERIANSVVDTTLNWFMWGMTAPRSTRPGDARRALALLTPLRRTVPGRHRYQAVRAGILLGAGRRRAADRCFRRAYLEALSAEHPYPHEAALISEYRGDALRAAAARRPAILEPYLLARSLYERWGAVHAAGRVSAKLDQIDRRGPEWDPPESSADAVVPPHGGMAELNELRRLGGIDAGSPKAADPRPNARESVESMRRMVLNAQSNVHLLFTTLGDAILLVNDSMEVLYHNPPASAFVASGSDGIDRIIRSIAVGLGTAFHASLADGVGREQELDVAGRTLRIVINPAPSAARATRSIIALSIRDITEARDQERQLIIADRLASLGMLASTIAHEVGNPNHVIGLAGQTLGLLIARLAERGADSSTIAELKRTLDHVMEGSRRVDDVIRHVREFGRGGTDDQWEETDTAEICGRVLRFTRIFAARFTDNLEFEEGRNVPRAVLVRSLIEQALINLITNACQALPDRSARVVVSTRFDAEHDAVVFAVSDEGPGIAPVFASGGQPAFLTGRAADGGTGLGLSIVRSIAARHRGHLRFRSDDRFATIAELVLPVDQPGQGIGEVRNR